MPEKPEKIHDRMTTDLPVGSVVSIAIVSDPYSDKGEYIQVLRSIRDDPLAGMLSRRQIDDAQYQAGRMWQALHQKSTIGAIRAIDPAREAVDGGTMQDFLSDSQIAAFRRMKECWQVLSESNFPGLAQLMFDVLAGQMSITRAAFSRGATTKWQIQCVGRQFRSGLEMLAIHFKLASPKRVA